LPTAKLILFVIKTRLSRPLLMFTLFIVAYGLASGAFLYTHHVALPASEVRSERAMAVIYSAIVVFLSSFMGGITVLKSGEGYGCHILCHSSLPELIHGRHHRP